MIPFLEISIGQNMHSNRFPECEGQHFATAFVLAAVKLVTLLGFNIFHATLGAFVYIPQNVPERRR